MNTIHPSRSATDAIESPPRIGIFDSGVGGLSVLRAMLRRLPTVSMIYVGDVSQAPYGERPTAEIVDRCERIVSFLADQGATMIVVACNTATVTAIAQLRERWPALTFVGVEPGVKPAAAHSRARRIAVLATPATSASERLRQLVDHHAAGVDVHILPCPGLAAAIERGALHGPELLDVLQPLCNRARAAQVDTVVLGCTHYAFVADTIQKLLGPGITLIDTTAAIAERIASLWPIEHRAADSPVARVTSTGSAVTMQRLLSRCPGLETTRVEPLTI
jgi:glutamate racemase